MSITARMARLQEAFVVGMLISVEPGGEKPGGGVRHSDTVLITEDGYESLTRYPAYVGPSGSCWERARLS